MRVTDLKVFLNVMGSRADLCDVCAEHDELNIGGVPPEDLTDKELAILDEANWHWTAKHETWTHYT